MSGVRLFYEESYPRSVKRFINRVRYFAMCLRTQKEGLTCGKGFFTGWQEVALLKGSLPLKQEEKTNIGSRKMSEPILVAMSAIHHVNTVLVEQDGLFSNGAYKALKCQKK